jgi:hypothetical protein
MIGGGSRAAGAASQVEMEMALGRALSMGIG